MEDRIPSNIIIKSIYSNITKSHLMPNYLRDIVREIIKYIEDTEPNYYSKLEIEAKLGHFDFRGEKISLFQYINETFRIPELEPRTPEIAYNFNDGIPKEHFFLIWDGVRTESQKVNSGIIPLGAFTIIDTIYKSNQRPEGKRESKIYKDGKLIKEETIIKEEKKHFNVRHYGNDFRITCCKEIPNSIESDDKETFKRNKFRTSYQFSYFRIDFTITTSSKEGNSIFHYEIEIEINKISDLLLNSKNSTIRDTVGIVLERFVQNIINLYSIISSDNVERLVKSKIKKFKSKFGNYLDNNMDITLINNK